MLFLDNALNMLTLAFMRGYNNLHNWITGLLALIFLIDLLFLAVKWMLGMKDIKETANKVLNYGIWFLAVLIFPYFMAYTQRIFTSVGLTAGNSASQTAEEKLLYAQQQFLYGSNDYAMPVVKYDTHKVPAPASILAQGIKNAQPLLEAANYIYTDLGARLFYMICWFLMMISYVIMTVQYLVTYLEFSVLIGIGGIFMPFGVMQETRFLSEKFLGAVTGHGIKIMLLNFIFAVGNLVLANISEMLNYNLKPDTILTAITVSVLFMVLAQNIPAMAVGILSGTPALNDAHMANTLRTVASAAHAMRTVGQVAAFAGRGGLQAGVSMAGGLAKAIGAGNRAANNFSQNVDAGGFNVPRSGSVAAWAGGAAGSLLRSSFNSMVSGAGKGFNRAMWGKDAKYMPQLQKPNSLRTIGRAGNYIGTRFNAGQNSKANIGNIAGNSNFKEATKVPYIPHFAAKPLTFVNKPGDTATNHFKPQASNAPEDAPSDREEKEANV